MCGIVGYIGSKNAVDTLKYGLKNLEYRGYDSAGIAYFLNDKKVENKVKKYGTAKSKSEIKIVKSVGNVDSLFKKIEGLQNQNIQIGIGHTRWATHGRATLENCHPHKSENNRVVLVHNGIIENHLEIKEKFLKNCNFYGDTDTEIVANLIEKFYLEKNDKCDSIMQATKILKGTFALAILFEDDDEKIFFAKRTSPLLIGISDAGTSVCSDVLGFDKNVKKVLEIDDNCFGYIQNNVVKIFDLKGNEVAKKPKQNETEENDNLKNGYPHFMLKEIYEIPKVLTNLANIYSGENTPLKKLNHKKFLNIERIRLIACGTSYHASIVGEKLFKKLGYDATSEIASEFIYSPSFLDCKTLCIFVSQSGETADTLIAQQVAKKKGVKTVAITNVLSSTLAKNCDFVLPICSGKEIAVASTKAYNAQLLVLMFFAEYLKSLLKIKNKFDKKLIEENIKSKEKLLKNGDFFAKNIKKMAKNIKISLKNVNIKKMHDDVLPIVNLVKNSKNIFMLGKDFDFVLAMESSLKLKEISYINSATYPSGELKHGTISLIDENSLVFVFATESHLQKKAQNTISQVESRGGKVVLVTELDKLLSLENIGCKISLSTLCEKMYPLFAIIPMQLLAYRVSTSLGHDPDKPRNLAKSVTVE